MDRAVFPSILVAQRLRYPLMQPQDYGKLAYQSEFGPEHMVSDREQARAGLAAELAALPADSTPRSPEDIGNGLYRFPLSGVTQEDVALLAELFCRTAQDHTGTAEGLAQRLREMERLDVPKLGAWLAEYRARGCPAVHHSAAFREAYRPHYRLLTAEYAHYFPVLRRIAQLMRQRRPAVVSIDGRCGSGKTHLAQLIAALFPCNVFHTDDFYLPVAQRADNWKSLPGGNMDFARLSREVLLPVRAGERVIYRPYSCPNQAYAPPTTIPPKALNIVEGSYSQHPDLAVDYDLHVFLTCSPKEQARRLRMREGEHFTAFVHCWIPLEEQYFAACQGRRSPVLTVDTSDFFPAGA